jgi:hypothetical protein
MIIAQRVLYANINSNKLEIRISIYCPRYDNDQWTCDYEICWPKMIRKSSAFGIDAVQSLILALNKIAVELYTSEFHQNENLIWQEEMNGYGFPLSYNLKDISVGDDKKL